MAVAYANIAQRTARKDLELKATSLYRTSLETVKNNLSDPQLATSDVNMTAVILLGIYEVSTSLLQQQTTTNLSMDDSSASITPRFSIFLCSIAEDSAS